MTNNKNTEKHSENNSNQLDFKKLSAHELFELGEKTDSLPLIRIHEKNKNSETSASKD